MSLKSTDISVYAVENSCRLPDDKAWGRLLVDVVNKKGFAYGLFGSDFAIPSIPKGYTLRERNATMLYTLALDNYIDSAEQCAKDHDFELVHIDGGDEILRNFDQCDDSSYQAGIGITIVNTEADFDRFFKMINAEYETLNTYYNKICELAEKLRSLP